MCLVAEPGEPLLLFTAFGKVITRCFGRARLRWSMESTVRIAKTACSCRSATHYETFAEVCSCFVQLQRQQHRAYKFGVCPMHAKHACIFLCPAKTGENTRCLLHQMSAVHAAQHTRTSDYLLICIKGVTSCRCRVTKHQRVYGPARTCRRLSSMESCC